MGMTTIQVNKKVVKELKEVKDYPEQTYNALLAKMIRTYKDAKARNQYDEFLHKVQQKKMKEIWDNKTDEAWEDV